jgi:hypothetical protein
MSEEDIGTQMMTALTTAGLSNLTDTLFGGPSQADQWNWEKNKDFRGWELDRLWKMDREKWRKYKRHQLQMYKRTRRDNNHKITNLARDARRAGLSPLAAMGAAGQSMPNVSLQTTSSGSSGAPSAAGNNAASYAIEAMLAQKQIDAQVQIAQLNHNARMMDANNDGLNSVEQIVKDMKDHSEAAKAYPIMHETTTSPVPLPDDSTSQHYIGEGRPANVKHRLNVLGQDVSLWLPTDQPDSFFESPAMWINAYTDPRNKEQIEQLFQGIYRSNKSTYGGRLVNAIIDYSPASHLARFLLKKRKPKKTTRKFFGTQTPYFRTPNPHTR